MTNQSNTTPRIMGTAAAGLRLGFFLLLSYVLWMYIPSIPFLAFLYLISLILIPIASYRLTKSFRGAYPTELPFSTLIAWSYGTQTFFFAGVIILLPSYYYFTQALPQQLPILDNMIEQLQAQNPQAKVLFDQLYGGNPVDMLYRWVNTTSVWAYLWSTYSMTIFLGAIISLINALFLKRNTVNS